MQPTTTAYGIWNGGRFVRFGKPLGLNRLTHLMRHAYQEGMRTFVTADVYGRGAGDRLVARALEGFPRDSYCLVGMVGHDFYEGARNGAGGWSRFTDPALRSRSQYAAWLERATAKSLKRCGTDYFDVLLLHNPDFTGYHSAHVWEGLDRLRQRGMTQLLGIAPGPANGFALDIIHCLEQYGELINWAMLILNPLEPWPMSAVLQAARRHHVAVMARVVECGGLFHDDIRPGHLLLAEDHRRHRPRGWLEKGTAKIEQMRPIAKRHGLTLLQLAALWTLRQSAVKSIVPTLMQENGRALKSIEAKLEELLQLPAAVPLDWDELETIAAVGDNRHCPAFSQAFKGASPAYFGPSRADRWPMTRGLATVAERWEIPLELLAGQDSHTTHQNP